MQNFSKKVLGLAGTLVFAGMAFGQATCSGPMAGANLIRNESTTDQVADLTFTCTAGGGGAVNILVFSSLPVTSKVLNTTGTAFTEALAVGGTAPVQGTVSGSQISFTGVVLPAGAATITITNVRVNATSLSVGSGTPPAVTESVFISGSGANAAALAATPVAYVLPGLTTSKDGGIAPATGPTNAVVCAATTTAANQAGFTVNFGENFPTAFKTQGGAGNAALGNEFTNNTETGYVPAAFPNAPSAGVTNIANSGTRVKIVFTNVPANVTVYVPTTVASFCATAPCMNTGTLTLTASETGAFSAVAASTTTGAPAASAAVTITGGTGQAVYEVTAESSAASNTYSVPVIMTASANTVTASATPVSTAVSFAPVGSTSIPNFVIGSSTTTFTGSSFSLCSTSLLFPFVTNQLGFDTGIAISNTSTDNLASNGTKSSAVAQNGTCTLAFYGSGAPSPNTVTTPNVPTATTYTVVLSSIAAGFQGYVVANCGFQYAHAFVFVTSGLGTNQAIAEGYLALVLPAGTGTRVTGNAGESLGE